MPWSSMINRLNTIVIDSIEYRNNKKNLEREGWSFKVEKAETIWPNISLNKQLINTWYLTVNSITDEELKKGTWQSEL